MLISTARGTANPDGGAAACLFVCRIASSGADELASIFNLPLYVPDPPEGQRSHSGASLPGLLHPDEASGAELRAAEQLAELAEC